MVPVVVASTVPANCALAPVEKAPRTAQNTLDACAPPVSLTFAPAPRDSAPPTWMTNTAFGTPPAFRVSVSDAAIASAPGAL